METLKIEQRKRPKAPYKKSEAVKELERLANEEARAKYPTNPFLAPRTFRDDTANGLTSAIIAYIRLKGGQAERVNTTGRPIDKTTTFTDVTGRTRTIGSIDWIKGNGTKGSADIHCCVKGRAVRIEVKIGSDRQSQAQRNYQKQVETAFGVYYIARTFESFKTWFDNI